MLHFAMTVGPRISLDQLMLVIVTFRRSYGGILNNQPPNAGDCHFPAQLW
eukprot:CAMPEP_0203745622 /NCGR_PEP_ID=MMETSP0098-20131031/1301_1 /ASSEMBLY_ACC=CAM_ASM_000208 /TAXON_ID=96639 /ORGANISM=" , Strain NY0313808BC1" /LENGTH=49 /DNA_ID= /DNA_START= /DNA_END= /DNA_ORIENTATION=